MPISPPRRRDLQYAAASLMLATVIVSTRLLSLQGFTSTVRVSGGSMAEAYCGEHLTLHCSRCQLPFRVDALPWRDSSTAVCPNCGQALTREQVREESRGQRVLIDRAAYCFFSPARWDVVAFREPQQQELAIKRIVALPGEQWQILRGDLLVNRALIRKSPRQFLEMAVRVHDDHFRPAADGSRWRSSEGMSSWRMEMAGWYWARNTPTEETGAGRGIDWLVYHHAAHHPAAHQQEAVKAAGVRDVDAYNSALARPLQPVCDVWVKGRFQATAGAMLHFRIYDGYTWRQRSFNPKGSSAEQWHTFLFGLCDRTLWLLIDGQPREREELAWLATDPEFHPEPLSIGGAGEGSIRLELLAVERDLHYLDPRGVSDSWSPAEPLLPQEYAVLGDNSPVSVDSRHWGGVKENAILGRVLLWSQ